MSRQQCKIRCESGQGSRRCNAIKYSKRKDFKTYIFFKLHALVKIDFVLTPSPQEEKERF